MRSLRIFEPYCLRRLQPAMRVILRAMSGHVDAQEFTGLVAQISDRHFVQLYLNCMLR